MASRKDNKGRVLKTGESQRKDGTYQYRYNDSRGKRVTVYAKTLNELRVKEGEIQSNLLNGLDFEAGQMTVEELLQHLLIFKRNLNPRTVANYQKSINRIRRSALINRRISTIKIIDCKRFVLWLADQGYKTSTVKETCIVLKAAFRLAFEEDAIRKNPMDFKIDFLDNDQKEVQALSDKQVASLISFMENDKISRKHLNVMIILLETGMRMGELAGLTFKDVDMKNKVIHINQQLQRCKGKITVSKPKTSSGIRTIPLSELAYEALQNVIEERKQFKTEPMLDGRIGFVFLSKNGKIKPPGDYNDGFTCVTNRYNAAHPESPLYLTPHVFRHTFCTNMVYAGMDIKSLQYVMGHANATMILRVYAHVDKTRAVASMKEIITR